ncbi:MAG: glycosyltransferase [Candidatus Marinimicrobia bacterium]|nr:glycosyltransferase [Candidatus Neomarinimicrobiota bacterium]
MKIAMLGVFPPFRGGIQHFNTLLYQHLKADHQVSVINFARQYPQLLFPGKSQYDTAAPVDPDFRHRLLDPVNPVTWFRTFNRLRSLAPELVIFKYWMPFFAPAFGTITRLLRKKTQSRSLCVIDNLIPHEPRPGDKWLNRYLLSSTDMFISMSATVEQDLQQLKPGAVSRCQPHPIYENFGVRIPKTDARLQLGLGDEPVLLYFGYIRRYKGVLTLLDALPRVVEQIGAKTIIAGEFYEDRDACLQKIETHTLAPHIVLADRFIPDDEVNLYFSAADVVVLPYLSATQSGIVSIALNYDLPCIVTDVGGLPEVVHHNKTGMIVPPGNPQALAEAIISYFGKTDRQAMIENITKEKKRYSWQAFTEVIFELAASS